MVTEDIYQALLCLQAHLREIGIRETPVIKLHSKSDAMRLIDYVDRKLGRAVYTWPDAPQPGPEICGFKIDYSLSEQEQERARSLEAARVAISIPDVILDKS